jgi:hypothetical protein
MAQRWSLKPEAWSERKRAEKLHRTVEERSDGRATILFLFYSLFIYRETCCKLGKLWLNEFEIFFILNSYYAKHLTCLLVLWLQFVYIKSKEFVEIWIHQNNLFPPSWSYAIVIRKLEVGKKWFWLFRYIKDEFKVVLDLPLDYAMSIYTFFFLGRKTTSMHYHDTYNSFFFIFSWLFYDGSMLLL